jgi:hypothetical protein
LKVTVRSENSMKESRLTFRLFRQTNKKMKITSQRDPETKLFSGKNENMKIFYELLILAFSDRLSKFDELKDSYKIIVK